jgi:hypothetical protein
MSLFAVLVIQYPRRANSIRLSTIALAIGLNIAGSPLLYLNITPEWRA